MGIAAIVGNQAYYIVPAGQRAVIFDRWYGIKPNYVAGEGLHLKIPFWQWPHLFNVRITPKKIETETGTKDLQTIKIGLRVLYRPQEEKLPYIKKKLGTDYAERILPSIGQETLKSVVAHYNAEELITRRVKVSQDIRDSLTLRAKDFFIILDDVSITDLSFGQEYSNAVEQKQVAQQEAERAKFIVQKAEQERLAAVIRAEGEAEGARLITEATNAVGASFIELRRIEAAKEIAQKLSSSNRVLYVPGSGSNMLFQIPNFNDRPRNTPTPSN
uniref:Prohibitin n=1 Tax=Arcella intermedia TaxID=1963864 RepID=A0A6B2LDF9_9EUKA